MKAANLRGYMELRARKASNAILVCLEHEAEELLESRHLLLIGSEG